MLKGKLLETYPEKVVSLVNISSLKKVEVQEDGLHLGAMTTLSDIAENDTVRKQWGALADAAYSVATPNLRSSATIGGNICQDVRCWYYRYPDSIGGRVNCARKEGHQCYAMKGENRYHSIFGAMKVCPSPCTHECPAHTDIPAYMEKLRDGDWEGAAQIVMQVNPMPMLTSRVCPHPCQDGCNQNKYGESVGIHCVERSTAIISWSIWITFIRHRIMNRQISRNQGAGPSGLAAAYYLRRAGHSVTVYEKWKKQAAF